MFESIISLLEIEELFQHLPLLEVVNMSHDLSKQSGTLGTKK